MLKVLARFERQTASPGAAAEILHHNVNMDVRYALGAVRVPTLVVHRTGDPIVSVQPRAIPRRPHRGRTPRRDPGRLPRRRPPR